MATNLPVINNEQIHLWFNQDERKWIMSFGYNDWTIRVLIDHHYATDELTYRVELWYEGVGRKFETREAFKIRMQAVLEHEGEEGEREARADPRYVRVHSCLEKGIVERVQECLFRWEMIRRLVSPSVCI